MIYKRVIEDKAFEGALSNNKENNRVGWKVHLQNIIGWRERERAPVLVFNKDYVLSSFYLFLIFNPLCKLWGHYIPAQLRFIYHHYFTFFILHFLF